MLISYYRLLNEREALNKTLDMKLRKRDSARLNKQDPSVIKELEDELDDLQANIDYVQDNITEAQHSIMQLEESKDTYDTFDVSSLTMNMTDLEEAGYLIEKLYNMTVNQSYIAAQRDLSVKELEARLNEVNISLFTCIYKYLCISINFKSDFNIFPSAVGAVKPLTGAAVTTYV